MKDYEGIKLSLENEAKERMNESKFEGRNLFWVKEEKSTEKNEWKKKIENKLLFKIWKHIRKLEKKALKSEEKFHEKEANK